MSNSPTQDQRIAKMLFSSVYPLYVAKVEKKGRTKAELICGHRVEQIEDPLTQKVRYLDKLVDELAKGKKIEKILRAGQ